MLRKSALLLLISLTACAGGVAMPRMRPGSNMVLPDNPSIVEEVVRAATCKRDKPTSMARGNSCALPRLDSLPVRQDTIP